MDKLEMTPEQQLAFDGFIDICSNYNRNKKCSRHSVCEDELKEAVEIFLRDHIDRLANARKMSQSIDFLEIGFEAAVMTALQKEMDLKAESGKICAERKELQRSKADEAQRRLKDMERSLDQLYEDQRESFESYKAGMTEKDTFLQQKQVYEQMEERLKDKIRQQNDFFVLEYLM